MAMYKESVMSKAMRTKINNNRKEGKYTDVVIETDDGDIYAHKLILTAIPWQVSNQINTNNEKIILRNYKSSDIEKIINFIYTENIDIKHINDSIKFCKLSMQLGLQFLEQLTITNLIEKCQNIENSLDIWRFAKKESVNNLRTLCDKAILADLKTFMIHSIESLTENEITYFLRKSKLSDFENYEIIKKWGELLKDSIVRLSHVKELFTEFIIWSNIELENHSNIRLDDYMKTNFTQIIFDNFIKN